MKVSERVRHILLAAACALVLWFWLIAESYWSLSRDPLTTREPVSQVAVDLPAAIDGQARLTVAIRADASSSTAKLYFYLHREIGAGETWAPPEISVALMGYSDNPVTYCQDSRFQILQDRTSEELTAGLKAQAMEFARSLLTQEAEQRGDKQYTPNADEVSERVAQQRYAVIRISPTISTVPASDGKGGTYSKNRVLLSTECAMAKSAVWTEQGSQSRLDAPRISFSVPQGSVVPDEATKNLTLSIDVNTGDDHTQIQANLAPNGDRLRTTEWNWKSQGLSSWATVDGVSVGTFDGVSAVFQSIPDRQREQNKLFLAGVALGVMGTLGISIAQNALELLYPLVTKGFNMGRPKGAHHS